MTIESERAGIAGLHDELSAVSQLITEKSKAAEDQYRNLSNEFGGLKKNNDELRTKIEEQTKTYAEQVTEIQALKEGFKETQRMLNNPIYRSEGELAEADKRAAIEVQRRAFLYKGGDPAEFKPDMSNLIDPAEYRSAVCKLMKVGVESKAKIIDSFTDTEKRAFDAASLGTAFFSPELLGFELDCDPECGYLLDLYGNMNVSKSTYGFFHIKDYGALGEYTCDAKCDAPMGPEGNIEFDVGKTYDFRGVFCLQNKFVRESDFDILPFMMRSAQRSYRINRNRATLVGDGINQPLGWAAGGGKFPVKTTANAGILTATDVRLFLNSIPREYGNITAVMHQNVFAILSGMKDDVGRFLFGDGDMLYYPEKVSDIIRISNCLPDPTENLTKGPDKWDAGSFIMGAANWGTAYYTVTKTPLFFEQWEGQSSAWCVKYQFGAEDGGFVGCSEAGRILKVA